MWRSLPSAFRDAQIICGSEWVVSRTVFRSVVLPALGLSVVFGGYLVYKGASLLWLLAFLGNYGLVTLCGWYLSRRITSPVGRKRLSLAMQTLGWAGHMTLFEIVFQGSFTVAQLGGLVVGSLVFGVLTWLLQKAEPPAESGGEQPASEGHGAS
jgi:hypothetical protein